MTAPILKDAIDGFNANDLGVVLRTAGVNDLPKSKEAKTQLWLSLIGKPDRVVRSLAALNNRCRKALELLQLHDGELRTSRYRQLLEKHGIVKKTKTQVGGYRMDRPEAANDPSTFEEVLAALIKVGLIWSHTLRPGDATTTKVGFSGGQYVYIPAEVGVHLPPLAAPEKPAPVQVSQVLSGSARTCQRDLYLLWSSARESSLTLTSASLVRMSDLRRISGQLLVNETITTGTKETDYRRIFFLRRLTMGLGLAQEQYVGDVYRFTSVQDPAFFARLPADRVRESYQIWRDGTWWNELWNTYTPNQTRASGSLTDFAPSKVVQARRRVLETLAALASGNSAGTDVAAGWVALDEIAERLHNRDDEFLLVRATAEQISRYYYYYGQSMASPYLANDLGWIWEEYARDSDRGWEGVERVFIDSVLTEGMYWLGLVDIGYEQPVTQSGGKPAPGACAVRLTDMGRWLLLNGPEPIIPEETGRVVLQPNFRVFAFDPVSDSVLARLDSFAVRLNAERAIEYEINRDSIYRAQLGGATAETISAWLETTTGAALPQNVARTLQEWQTAFDRITVRAQAGWLEAARPELIDALLADPAASPAIIKRISPTGIIVRAGRMVEIEQALLDAGQLPARSSGAEPAPKNSIRLDEAGGITSVHAVPSLYVRGLLQSIAEPTRSGWQITPTRVARAAEAGRSAAAMIDDLHSMALGGVPGVLASRIKAWAGYYGRARLSSVVLIQFRDQEALDELRRDPALARIITPIGPEARLGLAFVSPTKVAELREVLTDRGVQIEE